jgi:predicted NBD/HSP70 family sugar kinase
MASFTRDFLVGCTNSYSWEGLLVDICEKHWPFKVAVDGGGTNLRIVAFRGVDENGLPQEIDRIEVAVTQRDEADFEVDFTALVKAIATLSDRHGPIEEIGLGIAGKVNPERTMLTGAGNLTHWIGRPLISRLEARFNCLIVLGGDAEAALLAEIMYGGYRGVRVFLVIWGTGVGGAFVVYDKDGNIIPMAGEFGHLRVIPFGGRKCNCGQRGCLEAYVGGASLQRIFRHFRISPERLPRFVWKVVARLMQVGLRNAIVTDPEIERVVFSGAIACKQPWMLPRIQRALEKELVVVSARPLAVSVFGESAGALGAIALLEWARGQQQLIREGMGDTP